MAAAMSGAARGQTQIDMRTQGKSIDFSSAVRTRPSKTGTLVPAVCTIGETFVKTDAAAGQNLYVCTAINVWTVQGVEVPDPTGKADQVLSNDGSGLAWQAFGGDVSGRPGALTVTGLSGRKLGSLTPLDGQFLKWNASSQQWEATTLAGVDECVRTDGCDRGTNRGLHVRADRRQRGDRAVTGRRRRPERYVDRSARHGSTEPASGEFRACDRAGTGLGRYTMGAAVICRQCDESVRTYRRGNRADWRLFILRRSQVRWATDSCRPQGAI